MPTVEERQCTADLHTMSSRLLAALFVLASVYTTSGAASIRYDQTQTGGTNVHLQIKNVEVLALLDDLAGSEYDYDYSDFTVKPPKPGGSSNSTNTTATNTTNSTSTTAQPDSSNTTVGSTSSETQEPLLSSTSVTLVSEESVLDPVTAAPAKTRRCGAGFYRDTLGRCRRIRRPHLQMMVNLARSKTTGSPLES